MKRVRKQEKGCLEMSLCADIKKLMYTHIESGGEAEVVSMNRRTFDRLAAEVDDVLNCITIIFLA